MSTVTLDTLELDRIARGLKTGMREVIHGLAFDVEAEAKQRAAVDTGAMRASIFTDMESGPQIVARVGPSVEYAPYVEFGTSRMAAQPFLGPALEQVAGKLNSGETWRELFE